MMAPYRNMTFCSADCLNRGCERNFNDNDRAAARIWWGGDDAPVALSDFRDGCDDFECAGNCDDGRIWNNCDPTSGQWVPCDSCGGPA